MKIIKTIDFKCIEINLEYKEQIITIKFEPYRTVDYIKEKAKNKILDLPSDIHLYYLGKDLAEFGSEKIGNFFKNREKVTIKLKTPPQNPHHKNVNSKSPKNIINNKTNKIYFPNNNFIKYKDIKNEEIKHKNLIIDKSSQKEEKILKLFGERIKNIKIEEFNKYNNLNRNKSETKLPAIKNDILINNINIIKNKKLYSKNIKRNKNIDTKEIELLCNCQRHNISVYCRNCKKFICVECKAEPKHKNHLILKLNMHNFEKNVKTYGRLIQEDIQKKIDMNRKAFGNNKEFFEQHNMLVKRKERILNKYQEVIKIYQRIMYNVDNKLKTEDKERATLVINAYNDLSQKMNKQLLELLDKLNNNYINCDKKIAFSDLRSFFDEINSKEETLSFLGKDIVKYHLKNEINTKLKSSLDKIDRALNEITDDKNPFNLDSKYFEELIKMEIIKKPKENKEKDLNNNANNNSVIINLNKNKIEEGVSKTNLDEDKDKDNINNDKNDNNDNIDNNDNKDNDNQEK